MHAKKKTKRCCRAWEVEELQGSVNKLRQELKYLSDTCAQQQITIYSADTDICVGIQHPLWHRIVCQYEGNCCLGGPRKHWQSKWKVDERGFHLESFLDQDWKGWQGQYNERNTLRFDMLPRDIVNLHHNHLITHIKNLSIYYPCAIYNDFTGELHRP